jgi:peptidoglycan/LPS O-acetylase OafA/YrhL
VHSTTPACADNLLFGCCLCALLRTSARHQILKLAPRIFAIGAAILICTGIVYHGLRWQDNSFVPTIGFTIVGISCAALLAMALRTGSKTQRLFSNNTMRFFGKYSYGLYVFHYSIDRMLTPHVRLYMNEHFHSKALAVLTAAAVVMAVTLPLALLSYRFYESRFLKLKRFFSYNQKAASTV